jgi:hypothetical protein
MNTKVSSNCGSNILKISLYNGTSPVTVRMSQWNTQQEFCQILPTRLNSAKFCQLDWILPNSAYLIEFWQILLTRLNSAKFCQLNWILASSSKVWLEDYIYACAYAHILTTKTSDYLVMRFLYYSFLFFTQCLILYKSYTLKFK